MTQQSAAAYVRHGQTPFFRCPTADATKSGRAAYEGADVVMLGVPWDAGVTYRPGARFAPYELRRVSATVQTYHPLHEIDVFGTLAVIDGGNIMVPPFDPVVAREVMTREIARVIEAGALPFLVGGDHSIALPALRALAAVHGPVAVLHVDAHLDTSSAEVWGEAFHHGTPFRHALEEKLIVPGGLFQVGIRASWGHPEEGSFVLGHGGRMFTMDTIEDHGIQAIAERVRQEVGDRPVYISFDIDGIDPAFAPGTGTPVSGGLSAREGLRLLRGLSGCNVVGMDLVEVCPSLDHADVTLHLGAQLLFEGLALAALERRRARVL